MLNKFSVIFPVYRKNDLKGFKKTFLSILNQTLQPNELIIIYDGPVSSEISKFVGKNKNKNKIKIKELKNSINLGLGKTLKKSVKLCSFPIVARVDCDDFNYKNRFKIQIDYMIKNNLDLLGANIIEVGHLKSFNIIKKNPTNYKSILNFLKFRNPFNHQTVIFKKKSIIKAGNYEDVPYFEDYFLWVKMVMLKNKVANIDKVLVKANIDKSFFQRRSGYKNIKNYFFFLVKCKKIKFLNIFQCFYLLFYRIFIYLLPIEVTKFFYLTFLRKKF